MDVDINIDDLSAAMRALGVAGEVAAIATEHYAHELAEIDVDDPLWRWEYSKDVWGELWERLISWL